MQSSNKYQLRLLSDTTIDLFAATPKYQEHLQVRFVRTLRIPDDGKEYPLPPGLGNFPLRRASDFADKVPKSWLESEGESIFLPMYQREAMWLSFGGPHWLPTAVKLSAGKVNAVSGEAWEEDLQPSADTPDYMVCPPQPWLDGFNTGEGVIRQFVAMPMGAGYTVEAQVTGKEEHGGLQFVFYPAKEGRFQEPPPRGPRAVCKKSIEQDLMLKILALLSKKSHLNSTQIQEIKKTAEEEEKDLCQVVISHGISETMICQAQAELMGLSFTDLDNIDLDPEVARCIPEDLSRRYGCVAVAVDKNNLTLAMINPDDVIAKDDIALITGFTIEPTLATEEAVQKAINQQYGVTDLVEVEECVKDICLNDLDRIGELGMAAGGKMKQNIYPDRHGLETWDLESKVTLNVHLVDIQSWCRITGEPAPKTLVSAKTYTDRGYPWFDLYDEHLGDLEASEVLAGVSSVAEIDDQKGVMGMDNSPLNISDEQVVTYINSGKVPGKG